MKQEQRNAFSLCCLFSQFSDYSDSMVDLSSEQGSRFHVGHLYSLYPLFHEARENWYRLAASDITSGIVFVCSVAPFVLLLA